MSFWSAPQQTRLTSVALEKVYWCTRQLQSPTVAESSRLDCCNNFVHRQQNTRTRFTLKFKLANVFCAHCKRFQSPCLTDNWSKIFTVCLPLTTPMPNALQQHSFQCLPEQPGKPVPGFQAILDFAAARDHKGAGAKLNSTTCKAPVKSHQCSVSTSWMPLQAKCPSCLPTNSVTPLKALVPIALMKSNKYKNEKFYDTL